MNSHLNTFARAPATLGCAPVSRLVLGVLLALAAMGMRTSADEPVFLQHMMNLQRFQALCQSTNSDPPIRVLIYGDSINHGPWADTVVDMVRRKFPTRNWVVTNRAIPGNTAGGLIYTAEADVYPFNPDLILFHTYGYEADYRRLLAAFRARTSADMCLTDNNYTYFESLDEVGIGDWNAVTLPDVALGSGACLADIRTPWKEYLQSRNLPFSALVSDGVHPNAEGSDLMESLVLPYLVGPTLTPMPDPYNCGRVKRIPIPAAAAAAGEWKLPFEGNRIVARVGRGTATVFVDGLPPNSLPTGGTHGRCSLWPASPWWPWLWEIGSVTAPTNEHWKLTIDKVTGTNSFLYSLVGDVTGPDGSGSTDAFFVSNSGRVKINPGYWWFSSLRTNLVAGEECLWTSSTTGNNTVTGAPDATEPAWMDLAATLPQGTHELRLVQTPGAPTVEEVIVYNPLGQPIGLPDTIYQLHGTNGFAIQAARSVQSSPDMQHWTASTAASPSRTNTNYIPFSNSPALYYRLSQ